MKTSGIPLETFSTFQKLLTSEYHSKLFWTIKVLQQDSIPRNPGKPGPCQKSRLGLPMS